MRSTLTHTMHMDTHPRACRAGVRRRRRRGNKGQRRARVVGARPRGPRGWEEAGRVRLERRAWRSLRPLRPSAWSSITPPRSPSSATLHATGAFLPTHRQNTLKAIVQLSLRCYLPPERGRTELAPTSTCMRGWAAVLLLASLNRRPTKQIVSLWGGEKKAALVQHLWGDASAAESQSSQRHCEGEAARTGCIRSTLLHEAGFAPVSVVAAPSSQRRQQAAGAACVHVRTRLGGLGVPQEALTSSARSRHTGTRSYWTPTSSRRCTGASRGTTCIGSRCWCCASIWVVYMDADVVVHNYSFKSAPPAPSLARPQPHRHRPLHSH